RDPRRRPLHRTRDHRDRRDRQRGGARHGDRRGRRRRRPPRGRAHAVRRAPHVALTDRATRQPTDPRAGPATLRVVTASRSAPHPDNTLNELSGEEWLYFTKSVLTTAYPSELGHAVRKAHGANKPPRLMARLIEFFSRTGELV